MRLVQDWMIDASVVPSHLGQSWGSLQLLDGQLMLSVSMAAPLISVPILREK